jgi:DNA-binding response OmpR family regulator
MNIHNDSDKKTILLVDDDEHLTIFLKKLLTWQGYNVLTASNGREAVEAYKTFQNR